MLSHFSRCMLVFCFFAGAGQAQQAPYFDPASLLERFRSTCSTVLANPDAYLASLPRPGPFGERVISVSPDQKAVSVFWRQGTAYDEVYLHLVGTKQVRECIVLGEYFIDPSYSPISDLLAAVAADPLLTITGGHMPQDYIENGNFNTVDHIYQYALDGLFPADDLTALVGINGEPGEGWELFMMVQKIVR